MGCQFNSMGITKNGVITKTWRVGASTTIQSINLSLFLLYVVWFVCFKSSALFFTLSGPFSHHFHNTCVLFNIWFSYHINNIWRIRFTSSSLFFLISLVCFLILGFWNWSFNFGITSSSLWAFKCLTFGKAQSHLTILSLFLNVIGHWLFSLHYLVFSYSISLFIITMTGWKIQFTRINFVKKCTFNQARFSCDWKMTGLCLLRC